MKRFIEFLLVLPLLLAILFIVIAFRTGGLTNWFSSATAVPTKVLGLPSASPTVAFGVSVVPYPTSTSTSKATITPTSAPTFVVIPPATKTAATARTNTPPPTATRTPIPTNTPKAPATATPSSQEMTQGIAAGNQVVRAIENYYLNTGRYPTALTDLIPAYLPGVPVTPAGQPFYYRFFDATHPMAAEQYWLSFRVSEQEHLTCTYMRRIEYWDCNFASP